MARVEIPAPGDLIMDGAGNVVANVTVSLQLAGADVTHYSDLTGGTSTTGGLKSGSDGTIVDGSGNRRYVDEGSYDLTILSRTRRIEAQKGTPLPINLAHYCTGDGTAEDATGFQAALTALPAEGGRLTSPPGKKYRLSTALTIDAKADVHIDLNGSYIESRIGSGNLLTITNSPRGRWISPRFRLMAGAPSSFIYFSGTAGTTTSGWSTVYEPVIWSMINIPANFDPIVIDGLNFWIEVVRPQIRINSGALTGTFRRGVSITGQSNACKVIGGSINHTDTGVHIDSTNASEVVGTAFENCTRATMISDAIGGTSCGGTTVHHIRIENCPIAVDLSTHTARTTFYSPMQIGDIMNQDGEATRGHEVWNPNNVPVTRKSGEFIVLESPWGSMHTGLKIKAAESQGLKPVIEIEQRESTNPVTSLTVAPGTGAMVGAGTLTVASTATPVAFAASGALTVEGTTAAGIKTLEYFTFTGTTGTTFTGVTRALGGTAAQAHEVGSLVRASFNRVFMVGTDGVPTMRSAASTPPSPVDDRLMLHSRASVSKVIAHGGGTAGAQLVLSVSDNSSGSLVVTDVAAVFAASLRPGADNTKDLGLIGTRWRNLYVGAQVNTGFQKLATDVNFTLTPITSPQNTLHTGTLTADRTITLSTTGAQAGMVFRVTRTGGGAFNLIVGGLKNLTSTPGWCEVIYDGAAWVLFQFGAL